MDKKFFQHDIFESSFNSFELDDGFLSKMDAEIKKNNINKKKEHDMFEDVEIIYEKKGDKKKGNFETPILADKKKHYYDSPINFDDLSNSDFIKSEITVSVKDPQNSTKTKCKEIMSPLEKVVGCLSPIHGTGLSNGPNRSFSSTPIRKVEEKSPVLQVMANTEKFKQTDFEKADFDCFEVDLFEDWDKVDINQDSQEEKKSLITLSQAMKLIEEAEKSEELEKSNKADLNQSVDLLTGRVVSSELIGAEDLFADSFNLSKLKSAEKKIEKIHSDISEVIHLDSEECEAVSAEKFQNSGYSKTKNKPSVAQKLIFKEKQTNKSNSFEATKNVETVLEGSKNISFDSNDSFDILTHFNDIYASINNEAESHHNLKTNSNLSSSNSNSSKKKNNSIDSNDCSFGPIKKRGKYYNIEETDLSEDSPSPKILRQKKRKMKKWNKGCEDTTGRQFIDSEAELSENDEASSDEQESTDYDKFEESFLDEESYFTQNCSADMTAKYLESVKTLRNGPGRFKIPESKPYDPKTIFSQFEPNTSTNYELDSFCVNDVDEEDSELHELEIAEKILEMDRKRKKKSKRNKKKVNT